MLSLSMEPAAHWKAAQDPTEPAGTNRPGVVQGVHGVDGSLSVGVSRAQQAT